MTPTHSNLPVVWTGFSPFRCFLWAVFIAEVVESVPSASRTKSPMKKKWQAGGITYEGVILFRFTSSQPHPTGCTSFVIPAGMEQEWKKLSNPVASVKSPAEHWRTFSATHKQTPGSEWPSVIHGMDLPNSISGLGPITLGTQHWHGMWHGDGINVLNSMHSQSMAVKYVSGPDGRLLRLLAEHFPSLYLKIQKCGII